MTKTGTRGGKAAEGGEAMRRTTLTIVLVLVLAFAMSATSTASPATGIAGHGSYGGVSGGYNITVWAEITPNGVDGYISFCRYCASGRVFQVVPPSATSDHWCIAARRDDAPGNNAILYIRDVGDRSGSDQWSGLFGLSETVDCTAFPAPDPIDWLPLDSGNFAGH